MMAKLPALLSNQLAFSEAVHSAVSMVRLGSAGREQETIDEEPNEYEAARAAQIVGNREKLQSLGLADSAKTPPKKQR